MRAKLLGIVLTTPIAVSYTHLDVYKRQDKLTAEQRERYLQASVDCQSSAPASGIVYELFVAGKGKTFTAKPKPNAEIASLLAKRSSCGKDTLYFSLRYLPAAQSILEY